MVKKHDGVYMYLYVYENAVMQSNTLYANFTEVKLTSVPGM